MLEPAPTGLGRVLLAAAAVTCIVLLSANAGALAQSAQAPAIRTAAGSPDPNAATADDLETPTDWRVRLDHPSALMRVGANESSDVYFVNRAPGWHIRTRPAAIFWPEQSRAEGNFRLEAVFHLYDPAGRNEGYGLFFGGVNLDADDITYDYFLVRNSGEFLIKGRGGMATELLQDWTPSFEIRPFTDVTETSVTNRLAVVAGPDVVAFEINGIEVARLPRNQVNVDGVFGVRINHFVDVHLADLTLLPLAEPVVTDGSSH